MAITMVMDHPLVQHKVAILRDISTGTKQFKELVSELAVLLAYEATRDLPLEDVDVQTPVDVAHCKMLAGKKMAIVPILRAGLGMVEGVQTLVPSAKVGHIGLYRDPDTLQPVEYYCKLPADIEERDVFVVDPMLATGGSAADAIKLIKENPELLKKPEPKEEGAKRIKFLGLIAAPEGIEKLRTAHPDVDIYVAALDSHLNDHGYIVPGLGDAGDRIFGTK